jgi:pseudouridylate synthase / pseudouridine kinase
MIIRPRNPILRCLTPCLRNIRRQYLSSKSSLFTVSEEVQDALQTGRPVVALETTIYTHGTRTPAVRKPKAHADTLRTGFPYPENVALASHLESIVRVHGAVPATIGILDGKAVVGLNAEQLYRLISSGVTGGTVKTSRRDLAYVCGLVLTPIHCTSLWLRQC